MFKAMDRRLMVTRKQKELEKMKTKFIDLSQRYHEAQKENEILLRQKECMENARMLSAKVLVEKETNDVATSVVTCPGCKNCLKVDEEDRHCYVIECSK